MGEWLCDLLVAAPYSYVLHRHCTEPVKALRLAEGNSAEQRARAWWVQFVCVYNAFALFDNGFDSGGLVLDNNLSRDRFGQVDDNTQGSELDLEWLSLGLFKADLPAY